MGLRLLGAPSKNGFPVSSELLAIKHKTIIEDDNMSSGTYEEELPSGGKLQVSKTSWKIEYYFPGPDYRYNGTFISVPGNSIEQYIIAFKDNWNEYQRLKASIPQGGEFSKEGKMGMTIRIGSFSEGVCLQSYHMPISTIQKLEKVISDYSYAAKRAREIQSLLASL